MVPTKAQPMHVRTAKVFFCSTIKEAGKTGANATREPGWYHAIRQAQIDKAQGKAAKPMAKKERKDRR